MLFSFLSISTWYSKPKEKGNPKSCHQKDPLSSGEIFFWKLCCPSNFQPHHCYVVTPVGPNTVCRRPPPLVTFFWCLFRLSVTLSKRLFHCRWLFSGPNPHTMLALLCAVNPKWSHPFLANDAPSHASNSVCDTIHPWLLPPRVAACPTSSSAAGATTELTSSSSLQICPPFVHSTTGLTHHFLDFHFFLCL